GPMSPSTRATEWGPSSAPCHSNSRCRCVIQSSELSANPTYLPRKSDSTRRVWWSRHPRRVPPMRLLVPALPDEGPRRSRCALSRPPVWQPHQPLERCRYGPLAVVAHVACSLVDSTISLGIGKRP